MQRAYEKTAKKKLGKFLDAQKDRVLANMEPTKAYDHLLGIDDENKGMADELAPLVLELANESGAVALLFAGEEELKFERAQALTDAIHASIQRMAAHYNADTLKALADTLAEGTLNGESLSKLKKRVEAVYQDAKGYRAERVARYETVKGSNAATEAAYRQTGYVTHKKWYTNPGACEYCRAMDGKTVALGKSFIEIGDSVAGDEGGEYAVAYDTVLFPPLHPNCRCTIIPVID